MPWWPNGRKSRQPASPSGGKSSPEGWSLLQSEGHCFGITSGEKRFGVFTNVFVLHREDAIERNNTASSWTFGLILIFVSSLESCNALGNIVISFHAENQMRSPIHPAMQPVRLVQHKDWKQED